MVSAVASFIGPLKSTPRISAAKYLPYGTTSTVVERLSKASIARDILFPPGLNCGRSGARAVVSCLFLVQLAVIIGLRRSNNCSTVITVDFSNELIGVNALDRHGLGEYVLCLQERNQTFPTGF